jgi:hypothetical protein
MPTSQARPWRDTHCLFARRLQVEGRLLSRCGRWKGMATPPHIWVRSGVV